MLKHLDVTRPLSVARAAALVGALAGLAAAAYFSVAGEPAIDDAIAIEEANATEAEEALAGTPGGGDVGDDGAEVSRSHQRGVGLFGGYALVGAAAGLLLAVTGMSLRGPWLDPFRRFVLAGAILGGAYTVVTWFKYPPNPPAVGDPDTADRRQLLFWLLAVLAGVIFAGAAHLSARLRRADWPAVRRVVVAGGAAVLAVAVVMAVLPANTDPVEVPATLVWRFRTASLAGNLIMWGLLSVGFGLASAEAARRQGASATAAGTGDQNSMPLRADTPLS